MSEMVSMARPWDGATQDEIRKSVAEGHRPDVPDVWCPDGWSELMEACWDQQPENRPEFSVIYTKLDSIRQTRATDTQQQFPSRRTVQHRQTAPDMGDRPTSPTLRGRNSEFSMETYYQIAQITEDDGTQCEDAATLI